MPHEYDDPFNPEMVDSAVARALELHRAHSGGSLERHIEAAIHEVACSCAVAIEDEIEQGRSGLHEAIFQEVRKGVERQLSAAPGERDGPDIADGAADGS